MGGKKNSSQDGVLIDYRALGTIDIDEFAQAILADIHALKDIYNVHYVTAPTLKVRVTNEYGDPLEIRKPAGGRVFRMDTHHFRPACKDYEL